MVCLRCVKAVEGILNKMDAGIADIRLGEVLLTKPLSPEDTEQFRTELMQVGFELLDDSRSQVIVKIKSIIVDHIHY